MEKFLIIRRIGVELRTLSKTLGLKDFKIEGQKIQEERQKISRKLVQKFLLLD
jgi:hypothetical protein